VVPPNATSMSEQHQKRLQTTKQQNPEDEKSSACSDPQELDRGFNYPFAWIQPIPFGFPVRTDNFNPYPPQSSISKNLGVIQEIRRIKES
jgi:hypothetical protein